MRSSAAIVVGAVLLAPLLAGCSGSGTPTTSATVQATPIGRLDPATVRLARVKFCDRVPDTAVRRALGGTAGAHDSWGNGDPLPGGESSAGTGEVTHELGCAWNGSAGAAARAWIFARSTTADFARTLVAQAGRQPGCTGGPATALGSPALLQTCTLPGDLRRIRRAGLFGDTWLTCELTGPAEPTLQARTDAWCAAAVAAVRSAS